MMPLNLRGLNAAVLALIAAILMFAFWDQFVQWDAPCSLCLLQRSAFLGICVGLAMNVRFGEKVRHYAVALFASSVGASVAARQTLLHSAPGVDGFGVAILGIHLYEWALAAFVVAIIGTAAMMLYRLNNSDAPHYVLRFQTNGAICVGFLCLIAFANGVLMLLEFLRRA